MFIVNVEGAIRKNDKWLIIARSLKEEHAGGLLSLVGGKVDLEGSTSDILEKTIKREIVEEVGVTILDKVNYVSSSSFVTDNGKHVINIVFLCQYASGAAVPKCQDEVESVLWLTKDEIVNHPNAPSYLKTSILEAESVL